MIYSWTKSWAKEKQLDHQFIENLKSTNSFAKDINFNSPLLIATDHQMSGRGRGSNTWISGPKGSALFSSWCFPLEGPLQPIASPLVGLAVFNAIQSTWPDPPLSLKAPNDLYIGEFKFAGILLELITQGNQHRAIIGLGINVLKGVDLETSTYLANSTSITENNWCHFLDSLYSQLQEAIRDGQASELSQLNCQNLQSALDKHPKQSINEVLSNGSIVTDSETIRWSDL